MSRSTLSDLVLAEHRLATRSGACVAAIGRVAAASRAAPSEFAREGLRFVRRDPETGEDYLRIPMPSAEVFDRALAAIGEMLGGFSR